MLFRLHGSKNVRAQMETTSMIFAGILVHGTTLEKMGDEDASIIHMSIMHNGIAPFKHLL